MTDGHDRGPRPGRPPTPGWPRTTATRCASSAPWRPAVGLVDRSNRDVIAVPGDERASWLHTLTTQHLTDLRAGQGSELLVLSPHGHVEQHALRHRGRHHRLAGHRAGRRARACSSTWR